MNCPHFSLIFSFSSPYLFGSVNPCSYWIHAMNQLYLLFLDAFIFLSSNCWWKWSAFQTATNCIIQDDLTIGLCEHVLKVKDTHAEVYSNFPWRKSVFSLHLSHGPSLSNFVFLSVSSVQLSIIPTALLPTLWHFMLIHIRVGGCSLELGIALHFLFKRGGKSQISPLSESWQGG